MAPKTEFASLTRSLDYVRDVKWRNNRLHVGRTGAEIKLDRYFFSSFVSATELYMYLVGLRASRIARFAKPKEKIAFFPEHASPWYNIWSVAQMAGFAITSDLEEADYIFLFEDNTYSNAAARLPEHLRGRLINDRCVNISKQLVANVFEDVFGYQLSVDPTTHKGPAVRKSQANGLHDGTVIDCPIPREEMTPGYVYQRLVNSSNDGERSEDLRFAYTIDEIPVVFHKYKALDKRFGTQYLSVNLLSAEEAFSAEELKGLHEVCNRIGLDFGAVDVMRDVDDGRIYVVDINKTCMPVLSLPLGRLIKAFQRISDTFVERLDANA
ncbi:MAG: hypothetical protein AAGC77_04030 [Pseudomonadota bacterium]